jgi:hypothetical protein
MRLAGAYSAVKEFIHKRSVLGECEDLSSQNRKPLKISLKAQTFLVPYKICLVTLE